MEVFQKARGGPLGLLPVALQVDPAAGAVDGDEQIRPAVLVSHGRQVLDIHVDVARLVVLDRLRLRLALGLRDEGPAVRDTVAHQQPLQRGAIQVRLDELPDHHQRVIGGQQQRPAQLHHDGLLCRRQRRVQSMRLVAPVRYRLPVLPLAHRGPRDVLSLSQRPLGQIRGPDRLAQLRGRPVLLMDGGAAQVTSPQRSARRVSLSTCYAK